MGRPRIRGPPRAPGRPVAAGDPKVRATFTTYAVPLLARDLSSVPTATRAFFKDVPQRSFVTEGETDEPSQWLIFGTGPSEMGVHPTTGPQGSRGVQEGDTRSC